jgi:hypothetical protein
VSRLGQFHPPKSGDATYTASSAESEFGRPSPSGDRYLPTPACEPWVPGSQEERGASTPGSDESRRIRRNAVSHPILQHAGAEGYGTSFLCSMELVGIRGFCDWIWLQIRRSGTNELYRPSGMGKHAIGLAGRPMTQFDRATSASFGRRRLGPTLSYMVEIPGRRCVMMRLLDTDHRAMYTGASEDRWRFACTESCWRMTTHA